MFVTSRMDAAGDANSGAVLERPAGGGVLTGGSLTPVISGINNAAGVAVDSAGDVFVVSRGYVGGAGLSNGALIELPAGGTQETLVSRLPGPTGVAVDAAGDVFVADDGAAYAGGLDPNQVTELPAGGGPPRALARGTFPLDVAVDSTGDVFVNSLDYLAEQPAGGTPETLVSGFNQLGDVAVDSTGDIFVTSYEDSAADPNSGSVIEVSPSVPSGSLTVSPGSGTAGSSIAVASVTPCPVGGASPRPARRSR